MCDQDIMSLSVCTTATCRPEIIRRTYQSFRDNLVGVDWSKIPLIINIDPIPDMSLRLKTIEVISEFFDDIIVHLSPTPNFTEAVDWCWTHANSERILHLEDDWILTKKISINDLIVDNVKQVILRAYDYEYKKMALSPSIITYDTYKSFAGKFDKTINPEIQLRRGGVTPGDIVVVGDNPIVADIGRSWLDKTEFRKPPIKSDFNRWILYGL